MDIKKKKKHPTFVPICSPSPTSRASCVLFHNFFSNKGTKDAHCSELCIFATCPGNLSISAHKELPHFFSCIVFHLFTSFLINGLLGCFQSFLHYRKCSSHPTHTVVHVSFCTHPTVSVKLSFHKGCVKRHMPLQVCWQYVSSPQWRQYSCSCQLYVRVLGAFLNNCILRQCLY
jgi:hypothetical protein